MVKLLRDEKGYKGTSKTAESLGNIALVARLYSGISETVNRGRGRLTRARNNRD